MLLLLRLKAAVVPIHPLEEGRSHRGDEEVHHRKGEMTLHREEEVGEIPATREISPLREGAAGRMSPPGGEIRGRKKMNHLHQEEAERQSLRLLLRRRGRTKMSRLLMTMMKEDLLGMINTRSRNVGVNNEVHLAAKKKKTTTIAAVKMKKRSPPLKRRRKSDTKRNLRRRRRKRRG